MSAGCMVAVVSCAMRMTMGDATFYDVSLRTEARGGNQASTTGVQGALEADPRLGVSWMDRRLVLGGAYLPRLTMQEQVGGVQVLHRAAIDGSWLLDGGWHAVASGSGSYGKNDFLLQTSATTDSAATQQVQPIPTAAQPVQPVPQLTTLQYVSGEASLGVDGPLAPRYRATARLAAFVTGGADGPSRAELPLQRGGRLGGELEWTASGTDALVSAVGLTVSSFETGTVDGIAVANETWRHALEGGVQVRVGAGLAATAERAAGSTSWSFFPSGEAGVHDQWLRVLDVDLGARTAAIIDRTTGGVYERADVTTTLTWQVVPRWTVAGSGSGGVVVQGNQSGDKIAAGDLRVAWAPVEAWEFAVGVRAFTQLPSAPHGTNISEGFAFVSVTVRDRDRL